MPTPAARPTPVSRLLGAVALAAALCSGGAAHAGLVTFDNPGTVDIDNATDTARYHEAGFVITGPAASFLPLDDALFGGFDDSPFTFSREGGGRFSLQAFDALPEDFGFGTDPGTLFLSGLLDGVQVASLAVDLTSASHLVLDSHWAQLTEVSFSATGGFALDNLAASVPEPSGWALAGVAMLAAAAVRRSRLQVSAA